MFSNGNARNTPCSQSYRKNNALVLSEDLNEDAVQTLVDVALGGLLPEKCSAWLSSSQHIHETFMRERREKKSAVAREIAGTKDSLQHVLREELVDRVISIFPYVLIQSSNTEGVYLMQVVGSRWPLYQRRRDGKYGLSLCSFT